MDTIAIDLLDTESGTQQRSLDEELIAEYTALIEEGSDFPPIEVIREGKKFYPWDGFHRIECARRLKQKTIGAHVTEGTLRDAIWLSFGANKKHGQRRERGVVRHIIEVILADRKWSKMTLKAIADHVGVSRPYVSRVCNDLKLAADEKKPASQTKNEEKESRSVTSGGVTKRAKKTTVKTKDGKIQERKSQESGATEDAEERPKDALGNVIPENLEARWAQRAIIWGYVSQLARLRDAVAKHLKDADGVFDRMSQSSFQANYGNLRRTLKSAMPHVICPYCNGKPSKCKSCKRTGFMSEYEFQAVPKELKK